MADRAMPDFVEKFLDEISVLVVTSRRHEVQAWPMGLPPHWHDNVRRYWGEGSTEHEALEDLRQLLLAGYHEGIIDIKIRKLKID